MSLLKKLFSKKDSSCCEIKIQEIKPEPQSSCCNVKIEEVKK